jgi:hypothetical protein
MTQKPQGYIVDLELLERLPKALRRWVVWRWRNARTAP